MTSFHTRSGGVEARFDAGEAMVLRELVGQVRALLHDRAEQVGGRSQLTEADPLQALTGLGVAGAAASEPPEDPVLARLLPDARRDESAGAAESASEYRRLTEDDLRQGKLDDADVLLDQLPPEGGKIRLDAEAADAWLRALNDVRLAMGTRLDVEEETEVPSRPDSPEDHALMVYFWLGLLQETLLDALTGGRA